MSRRLVHRIAAAILAAAAVTGSVPGGIWLAEQTAQREAGR